MNIIIAENYQDLSEKAAGIVAEEVKRNQHAVLGLATGSTPEGMYAQLVKMFNEKKVDFNSVVTFNLDEYACLSPEHAQSYHYYMHQHFFEHVNVRDENIHIPCYNDKNIADSYLEYDRIISEAGGIDLQVLGIGGNGHIGFNEPNNYLHTRTHLIDLSEDTLEANSRFFDSPEEVPRQAVTMGMGSIMDALKIILLASGKNKARAVQGMCTGKITTSLPASLLQLHRDITLLVDKEAASLL